MCRHKWGQAVIEMGKHKRGDEMQSYRQAVQVLPLNLRQPALRLLPEQMQRVEEVRLRVGRLPALVLPEGETCLPGCRVVEREDMERLVEIASRWSVHTVLEQLCRGFLPLEGGHRLGVCGTAVMKGERVHALRDISCANLRVARQKQGVGLPLLPQLRRERGIYSTLILAPPGAGKTTLLRDLIRLLSDGEEGLRVGVVDERGELAAVWRGQAQLELGERADVLTDCPKSVGIELLLRGMSPQVLAVDEITARRDVCAMADAVGCGVALLATAHGSSREDLERRSVYREMLDQGLFQRLITIGVCGGQRRFCVESLV